MSRWRDPQQSVGRIVFASLLLMCIGALVIAVISVRGIQSFHAEFDRLTTQDLPQATLATRLNAEISGLTGQIGSLAVASSELALGTIRLQIGDQLAAIDRLKGQLRSFPLRPGAYEGIDRALRDLTENLEAISSLSSQRLKADAAQSQHRAAIAAGAAAGVSPALQTWLHRLDGARRAPDIDALAAALADGALAREAPGVRRVAHQMLVQKQQSLGLKARLEGRLHRHMLLSAHLTDATRFMSSRLSSEAAARSGEIERQIRATLSFILLSLLAFATIATFIHIYLDRNVVGRIQRLTQRINAYEGATAQAPRAGNEITRIEAAFASLTETIAERENRLVALHDTATEARREAEQATRSKSILLAAASHDLRQPLHAMGLLIGGIDRAPLAAASRATLDRLAGLTDETIELFNAILDLSKLEAGTFTADCQPVDLTALLTKVEADFAPRAALAEAPFRVQIPTAPLYVLADEAALHRIINNLVGNAIAYAAPAAISLDLQIAPQSCELLLSDQGPGLEAEDRAGPAGYGLGLSISFALAEAMQTRLRHEPPADGGTRFILPLTRVAAPVPVSHPHRSVPETSGLAGLRVIFLEDHSEICTATAAGLTRLGCHVTAVSSAADAEQQIARADGPFVLISDLDLGRGQSALTLLDTALGLPSPLIGIIVTTADPSQLPAGWAEAGPVQLLEKPFAIGRLASLLRHMATQEARARASSGY